MLVILIVAKDRSLPLFGLPVLGYLIQDIHLIVGCLNIVLRTFLNLERYITIKPQILGEPHRGKVAPPEFLNNDVPIK